jgi:hypothetical protein
MQAATAHRLPSMGAGSIEAHRMGATGVADQMPVFFRRERLKRNRIIAIALSLAGLAVLSAPAHAACNIPGMRVSIAASEWLLRRPTQLLERYARGESGLVSETLAFATNDITLKPVVMLGANANAQQKRAIGEGLGRAAFLCQRYDSTTTRKIRELVDSTGDTELRASFRRAFQTGSTTVPSLAPSANSVRPPQLPGSRSGSSGIYDEDYRSGRSLGLPNVRSGDPLAIPPVPGVSDPLAPIR